MPARASGCASAGFNDDLTRVTIFPDVRALSWIAPDGLEIDGLLMTPAGADGPLPLLVLVHGGPTWCWNAYFSVSEPNAVLLADAGYAVLMPNPRGSIGRGHAFAQAVIGDPGGKDLQDILAGVDRCVADGVADPDRLGISGLSYGGYMAGWAMTQTDRFGASVAHSVDLELDLVPPHRRHRRVRRDRDARRVGRPQGPVRGAIAGLSGGGRAPPRRS